MVFVTINTDEEDHTRIMEFFVLEESELPSLRIIKLEEDMSNFKPESTELSEIISQHYSFCNWIEDSSHTWERGIPEDWDKEPFKVLVGKNFEEVAMNIENDVLVEFHDWSGHSKELITLLPGLNLGEVCC